MRYSRSTFFWNLGMCCPGGVRDLFACHSPQIAVLRGENAMAKTLQSAVEKLERDKSQLQSRVHSLEQQLVGTQNEDVGAPPSGEETAVSAPEPDVHRYVFGQPVFLMSFCRRRSSGAAEGREGVR